MGAVFVSLFGQEFMAMMRGDAEVVSSWTKKTNIQEMHIHQNGVKITVVIRIVLELSYLL